MALLSVHTTRLDERIARGVAAHSNRKIKRAAGTLTWGADEHVLLALAALGWVIARNASATERRLGNHFLACSLTTAALPHIIKLFIDQERQDRLTIRRYFSRRPAFRQGRRRVSLRPCPTYWHACIGRDTTAAKGPRHDLGRRQVSCNHASRPARSLVHRCGGRSRHRRHPRNEVLVRSPRPAKSGPDSWTRDRRWGNY